MRQFARPSVVLALCVLALCLLFHGQLQAQSGTWTAIAQPNPGGASGGAMLLSDGSVIVCNSNSFEVLSSWAKLTPDSKGNYINGTWSMIAPMINSRLFFASNVLPSGKVFVMGGEYGEFSQFINTGEIYDPVANKWSRVGQFPQPLFGDDPSVLLSTGKILCGFIESEQTYLYDPVSNSWAQTGRKLRLDQSDEETWILLPDGSVLSYDVFASPATGPGTAQRYVPSSGKWVTTGPVPVPLTNLTTFGAELGPMVLLPDGRVFLVGANTNTVLYNPTTDTWTQGPSLPANMGGDDAPAAMLPNGKVLFIADNSVPEIFTPPSRMFEFDPVANTITDVTPTGALGNILAENDAQQFCFLMLPNGHTLLTTGGGGFFLGGGATAWDFAPTGAPNAAWAPKINSVTKNSGTTYTLRGTQLNGISEGSSFGDDLENSTNYPIVRITTETGLVKYARTTNWSPGLVATGSRQTSVEFTLPSGATNNGVYQLAVIANGISSPSQQFVIGPPVVQSNVTAVYSAGTKTLTLTGDANANSLTVSLQAGVLKVEGANGTQINKTPTFSTAHSGQLVLVANMNDGDDAVSIIGVSSSTTNINLGTGNDKAAITLSTIGSLIINGGTGVDSLLTASSKITKVNETNIP